MGGRNPQLAGALKEGDVKDVKETHGVVVLFAVVFFGKIWGAVGMLISVPVISIVRLTWNVGHKYDQSLEQQREKEQQKKEQQQKEEQERKQQKQQQQQQQQQQLYSSPRQQYVLPSTMPAA